MGKRSNFARVPKDFYRTFDARAVAPLADHLPGCVRFAEPCAGIGDLTRLLVQAGHLCTWFSDLHHAAAPVDALSLDHCPAEMFITNPPWSRPRLHALIGHLSALAPTWLLFDAAWMQTKQSAPFVAHLHKVVAVGRLRWIPDTSDDGKDDCAWYLFDQTTPRATPAPLFFRRN